MAAGAAGRLPVCEKPLKSRRVLKVGGLIFDNFVTKKAKKNKKIYCRNSHDSDTAIDFKLYVAHV